MKILLVSPELVGLSAADLTRFSLWETDIQIVETLKSAFPGLPIAAGRPGTEIASGAVPESKL